MAVTMGMRGFARPVPSRAADPGGDASCPSWLEAVTETSLIAASLRVYIERGNLAFRVSALA